VEEWRNGELGIEEGRASVGGGTAIRAATTIMFIFAVKMYAAARIFHKNTPGHEAHS
jgi:hypothetical protein